MPTIQLYSVRLVREGPLSYAPVTQPYEAQQAIRALLHTLLHDRDREAAVAIALDARNRPIGAHVISVGTVSATLVHPREVFKFAILSNAHSLLFAHNHPSGDAEPSRDDIDLSRRLKEAGLLIGIDLIDSLITGHESFISLKERQLI